MSDLLSAADIEQAEDQKLQRVDIPEWNGHAFLLEWDDTTRDAYEEFIRSRREAGEVGTAGIRRRAVMLSLVSEERARIFDDANGDKVLRKKSAKVINRLFDLVAQQNGIGPKAIEQEKKDSEKIAGSDTDSA